METIIYCLVLNLIFFVFHFGLKRTAYFKSALSTLQLLSEAKRNNKRLGFSGWFSSNDNIRERTVYGIKYNNITIEGQRITEVDIN